MNNQLNWKLLGLTGMMMLWPLFGTAQVNLDSGLVAYFPFNGNANDESGNENDGTVLGATLSMNRFGQDSSAYEFDGVDDYIRIADTSDLRFSGNFSFSIWLYLDGDIQLGAILQKRQDQSPFAQWSLNSAWPKSTFF